MHDSMYVVHSCRTPILLDIPFFWKRKNERNELNIKYYWTRKFPQHIYLKYNKISSEFFYQPMHYLLDM